MNVLVLGSGGREHALVWKLARSPRLAKLWCAPGNAGIALERLASNGSRVECVSIPADDLPNLLKFAQEKKVDLTVVGPDNPLALGVADLFNANGLAIWGPNQKAAQFESSKVFSQNFMEKYGVPTAFSGVFTEAGKARDFATSLGGRCAVKADGLALGKGVIICQTVEESARAIEEIMSKFGTAGRTVLIQELLEGMEISLHALCDGKTSKLFPTSQDHKRILDNDAGPNTGGMGTYSPAPFLTDAELAEVGRKILEPWLRGCEAEQIDFRGILYPGVMLTKSGPKVLEFNARFGDPETQVYLPRLETDLLDLLEASTHGQLGKMELRWRPEAAVCVVMAAAGYPGTPAKGAVITGLEEADADANTKVFYAGVSLREGRMVTNGGRVLGVTAWDNRLQKARDRAYQAVEKIQFDGMQFRSDIAGKALRAGHQPPPFGHSNT